MGPLAGIRVLEIRGIGPGPYAGMLLADMGAEVVVVERSAGTTGITIPAAADVAMRGKQSIAINLKTPEGVATLLTMVEQSDVLFEGFRPGVAEKLGIGPDVCLARNPKLIYGRITGWGQDGPLSQSAGHDINYISLTGSLAAIGGPDKPAVPLNLIGDYAGGSHFLVMGILAALLEVQRSGKGQVIDAAITDGSANLMALFHTLGSLGQWRPDRQSNLLDGGAPFYDVYETADAKHVSLGSLEPQFFAEFVRLAELDPDLFSQQHDVGRWPAQRQALNARFIEKTRDEWAQLFEGSNACVTPVLTHAEAPHHPHNHARQTYLEIGGVTQPAPAPRFSRTQHEAVTPPRREGSDTRAVLNRFGLADDEISTLIAKQAVME
ncbi:MAG: CaiB/BaiF CoA transferase family protein [Woeseiaceae bacterium]